MAVEITPATPKVVPELPLTLDIRDGEVIQYLLHYESPQREEKALEALKVGVIAILSASPSLDTRIVEKKFGEVEVKLKTHADGFRDELSQELKNYFEKDRGDLPITLDSFLGERGVLSDKLKQYFDPETGKISNLLKDELGPSSSFARQLNPENKNGVISLIQEAVNKSLSETAESVQGQFSLDKDESGMSRIKKMIEEKIDKIGKEQDKFFGQLRSHLEIQDALAKEAEKGTQKGRDFQTVLYERIAKWGKEVGDTTEKVTETIGTISRCKVGDYVIELGETTAASGKRIVVEAKMQQSHSFKDTVDELKTAKENRKAECGIFVFAKGYEPIEMGDFKIDGADFYCTVDREALDNEGALLFLESAYKIARVQIVSQTRIEASGEIDLDKIRVNIKLMLKYTELMAELAKKAHTVKKHGEDMEGGLKEMKDALEASIKETLEMLK